MMIVEIDSPIFQTFPLITFIICGKSRKMKVSRSPLEELRKPLGLGEPQAAQAHYMWVRASQVIWSEYTRIISVLSDAK